jgi:hypothetical protein
MCRIQETLISKLALYGIPILVALGLGYILSNSWGSKAVSSGRIASGEIMAGWTCGLFLGALSFSGLLYGVSETINEDQQVISQASCYPEGWGIIAGTIVVIMLAIFAITKVNAKK